MSVTTGGLGGRAVRGASITMVGQFVRVVLLLGSTAVLSRLISPEDFGLVTIVMSVVALGELLRDFGLSTAAARSTTITNRQKTNLFWINTSLGIVLAGAAVLAAQPLAAFFGQPALREVLIALSSVFVLSGAAAQLRAEVNRRLNFIALTICDTAPVFLGIVSAVVFAFYVDGNYWALVVQQIVVAASGLLFVGFFAHWMPGLPNRASVREYTSFGVGLFGTQLVSYFTKNSDNVALGYFWGPAVTGVYGRAYQILMLPMNQLLAPLTRVAVPILSRVVDQHDRFVSYVISAQKTSALVLAITYGLLIGLADPAVNLVFGSQWTAMIPVFQALALGGIFRGMNQLTFWVYLAQGRTSEQFRFYLWSQPLIVVAMMCGLPWGALGVAIGHSIGYAINWVVSIFWCTRVTGINLRPTLINGLFMIVLLMIPAVILGQLSVYFMQDLWGRLILGVVSFSGYFLAAYFLSADVRKTCQDILRPLMQRSKNGKGV